MKTVTDEFKKAQNKSSVRYAATINLYRRYWTGTEYDYDVSPIDLSAYLVSAGRIASKTDSGQLNERRSGNVLLVLKNDDNYWDEENASGVWNTKVAYRSKIEIKSAVYLENGDLEAVYSFTGLIVKPVSLSIDTKGKATASITLAGWEQVLKETDAEDFSLRPVNPAIEVTNNDGSTNNTITKTGAGWGVNAYQNLMVRITSSEDSPDTRGQVRLITGNTIDTLTVTPAWTDNPGATADFEIFGEYLGAGDGATKDYDTAQPAVGKFRGVWIDGVEQEELTDYETRRLNEKTVGGRVTLGTEAAIAEIVTCDYIHWYVDAAPRWMVEQLCILAGFDTDEYQIDEIIMPNNVRVLWDQDDQVDFEAAGSSFQDVSAATEPGYLRLTKQAAWPRGFTQGFGLPEVSWKESAVMDMTLTDIAEAHLYQRIRLRKFSLGTNINLYPSYFRSQVQIETNQSDTGAYGGEEDGWVAQDMGVVSLAWGVWLIGSTEYIDSTTRIDLVAPKRYLKYRIKGSAALGPWQPYAMDNRLEHSLEGYAISAPRDCGATLKGFGTFRAWVDLDDTYDSDVEFYTRSAADDGGGAPDAGTWTDWEQVYSGQNIPSPTTVGTTQWLQTKTVMSATNPNRNFPKVDRIECEYATSKFLIEIADMTDKSAWDAIIELAQIIDYEVGVSVSGVFFMRAKRIGINQGDISISEDDRLVRVIEKRKDWIRMRNKIVVQHGKFLKTVSSETENADSPHSIDTYGVKEFSISGGNLLAPSDHDLATGTAKHFYGNYDINDVLENLKYPDPKVYCKLEIKNMMQLELGDAIEVTATKPGTIGNKYLNALVLVIIGISTDIMKPKTIIVDALEPY